MSTTLATVPDLLRLLLVPAFAWAAWRDLRTRRLPGRLWLPLVAIGVVALVWDAVRFAPFDTIFGQLFLMQTAISLFFVAPLAYVFWWLGGFGGADAKALITIAIALPTFPSYTIGTTTVPIVEPALGVFSFTILTNTVILAVVVPVSVAVGNLAAGRLTPAALFARPVSIDSVLDRHGRLFETRSGYTRSGLDLDALRMYLRWRGVSLAAIREEPALYRDPRGIEETFEPTDGAIAAGGPNDPVADDRPTTAIDPEFEPHDAEATEDPWGAEAFLESIQGSAYGTTPETLREGLETLVEPDREEVWVSPGFPFIVPMFLGLVVAFVYGDLLFGLLGWLGIA